ncbi:MAG: hypothetical protein ABL982_19335, partial [Vicinamibacterales bacterium]
MRLLSQRRRFSLDGQPLEDPIAGVANLFDASIVFIVLRPRPLPVPARAQIAQLTGLAPSASRSTAGGLKLSARLAPNQKFDKGMVAVLVDS